MQTIKEQITQTADDVKYIKVIIAGDPPNGVKGILQRFDEHERLHNQYDKKFKEQDEKIENIEKGNFKRAVTWSVVSGSGGVAVGAGLKTLLAKIFASIGILFK